MTWSELIFQFEQSQVVQPKLVSQAASFTALIKGPVGPRQGCCPLLSAIVASVLIEKKNPKNPQEFPLTVQITVTF